MRILNKHDLQQVAGGGVPTVAEAATTVGGIGSGVGASFVIDAAGGTAAGVAGLGGTTAITVMGAAAGGLACSGAAGYWVGSTIYDNLPTAGQSAVSNFVGGFVDRFVGIISAPWVAIGTVMHLFDGELAAHN